MKMKTYVTAIIYMLIKQFKKILTLSMILLRHIDSTQKELFNVTLNAECWANCSNK